VILGKTRISASGRTSDRHTLPAAGADAAGRPGIRTRWIAIIRLELRLRRGGGGELAGGAVGTETDGSIVSPRAATRWSASSRRSGSSVEAGSSQSLHSQDTPGPMARTVADAAVLLAAMSGVDRTNPPTPPADHSSLRSGTEVVTKWILDANGLKGARIGVVRDKLLATVCGRQLAEAAIAR